MLGRLYTYRHTFAQALLILAFGFACAGIGAKGWDNHIADAPVKTDELAECRVLAEALYEERALYRDMIQRIANAWGDCNYQLNECQRATHMEAWSKLGGKTDG